MSVREFIEAIASDNSLRNACIFMNQNGYLPSCVNQNHGAILEKIIASTGELDEVLVSKWLQAAKVPEFLLKHYWRAISSFSQNNKVGAYQIFFALCAITAPHEGVWRDIRDRYIFAAFDSDGNQQLDLLEFRIFVYSILFTSGMVILFFLLYFFENYFFNILIYRIILKLLLMNQLLELLKK